MIFKPELCDLILSGRKTQTRRLAGPGDVLRGTWVERQGRRKWRIGDTYTVQRGRGKRAEARIVLIGIRQERLQEITAEGCQAEGIRLGEWDERLEFQQLWDSIHHKPGTRWGHNPLVWVLTFKLVQP